MKHRMRLLLVLTVIGLGACGTPTADDATGATGSPAPVPADLSPITELGVYNRSGTPSTDPDATGDGVLVKIADGRDNYVWETWGPTRIPAIPAPAIPDGSLMVLAWVSAPGLEIHGYGIGAAGELILVGEFTDTMLPAGCVTADFIDGKTHVFSISGPDVSPGMPVGRPEITTVTVKGSC